jgi:hypothetical protein
MPRVPFGVRNEGPFTREKPQRRNAPLGLLSFDQSSPLYLHCVEKENPSATVVQSTVGVRRDPVVLLDLLWVSGRPEAWDGPMYNNGPAERCETTFQRDPAREVVSFHPSGRSGTGA